MRCTCVYVATNTIGRHVVDIMEKIRRPIYRARHIIVSAKRHTCPQLSLMTIAQSRAAFRVINGHTL